MLHSLHWLPIEHRIEYKFALLQDHFSSGCHLPFRTSSPLHSLPTAPLFYRHPSVQNTILPNKVLWSALSLTRLHLSGTNSLFLSVILPLSALLNLPWKPFSFWKPFLQSHCPDNPDMRLVCVCVCVRACASLCLCALNFDKYAFVENM